MATNRICEINNCGKKHFGHGLCSAHYFRWKKHGDPLGGNTASGDPMRYFNDVVLAYNGDDCLIWPYAKTSAGYGHMYINGAHKLISRLVCEAMNGSPPSKIHEAAHKCGKGNLGCVSPKHLSWKTPKQNAADRIEHGTNNRILTDSQIKEIIALNGKISQVKIAKNYGVNQTTISRIHRRKSYRELTC